MAGGRAERDEPRAGRQADQPRGRVPSRDRSAPWSCQEHDLHLQGRPTRRRLRLQALHHHPLRQLGTGRGLPRRHQDGAGGERRPEGRLRRAGGQGLEVLRHPADQRRQDRGNRLGQEDPWPTSQAVASRPHRLRRSGERRERQHAGSAAEDEELVRKSGQRVRRHLHRHRLHRHAAPL